MRKSYAILGVLVLLIVACQQQTVDILEAPQDAPQKAESPQQVEVSEAVEISEEQRETIVVDGEIQERPQMEAPTVLPDDNLKQMSCSKLQNMTSTRPEALGENTALAIAVGTDGTKKGVYDLGYMLNTGLFRIGQQGLKGSVVISIKLRGPGSIQSQPLDLTFQCDNQTYYASLPAMSADTIFYVDTYGRLYWRDTDHDGTGITMDAERALVPEHRLTQ